MAMYLLLSLFVMYDVYNQCTMIYEVTNKLYFDVSDEPLQVQNESGSMEDNGIETSFVSFEDILSTEGLTMPETFVEEIDTFVEENDNEMYTTNLVTTTDHNYADPYLECIGCLSKKIKISVVIAENELLKSKVKASASHTFVSVSIFCCIVTRI